MKFKVWFAGFLLLLGTCLRGEILSPVMMDDTIRVDIQTMITAGGDSICADLVVSNFDSIVNMQFSVRFDPNVLELDCNYQTTFGSDTPLFDENWISTNPAASSCDPTLGYVALFWNYQDPDQNGVTLPDGTTIMRICWKLIGDPCETSPIFISSNPTFIEFVQADGTTLTSGDGLIFQSDSVSVASDGIGIFARHCNAEIGMSNGNINFYPCGGTPPYTWMLDGVPQTSNLQQGVEELIPDLARGQYVIKITDATGTMATETIIVDEGVPIEFDLVGQDPTCFYRDNGRMRVENIMGGISPYDVQWSNFEFDTDEISRLPAGEYSITITDFLGCSVSKMETLSVDTLFGFAEVLDSAACNGGTGLVKLTASGGQPINGDEYYFENRFAPQREIIIAAPSGPGTAVVEDDVSCVVDINFDVPVREGVMTMTIVDSVSCNGASDGRIQTFPSGDLGGYTYELTYLDGSMVPFVGGGNNNDYLNMNIAVNPVTNRDTFIMTVFGLSSSCSTSDTVIITQPEPIELIANVSEPTCNGNDGSITLSYTGGNPNATFEWDDASNDIEKTMLNGGTYRATVTDNRGCTDDIEVTLQDGGDLNVNVFASMAVECGSDNGAVTAEPAVAGNYTYQWSTSLGGAVISMDQNPMNLAPGTYYVTVTEEDLNCEIIDSATLVAPVPLIIDVDSVAPSCAVFEDGRLGIIVLNGQAPYFYEWADDPTIDPTRSVLNSLGGGDYAVTITDGLGCSLDTILTLDAPDSIDVIVDNIVDLDCFGDLTGEATARATGGDPMGGLYTFLWSSGSVGNGFSHRTIDLPAGTQWVLVGDGSCPSDTVFFTIENAPMIQLDESTVVTSPTCINECDANIMAVAVGGSAPYTFAWDDGPSGSDRVDLCAGEYIVEIMDANGCVQSDTIEIANPDTLVAMINPVTTVDLTCGSDPGQIGVAVLGGVDGGYTYAWTGSNSTEAIATDLQEGTYSVTATDMAGCQATASYVLSRPDPLVVSIPSVDEPGCFGERTCFTVDGASGGLGNKYQFSVNLGPLVPLDSCVSLFAGEYLVNVFDSSGRCSIDTMITITQPAPTSVDAGPDIEIDLGQETDPINLDILTDNFIDTIMWSPDQFINCLTADCQTIQAMPNEDVSFTVTVVDDRGCTGSDELFVRVNTTRRVVFPNIFSPNDDGQNDLFQVGIGNGVEEVVYLYIYDRWGNRMYAAENYLPQTINIGGWDGTYGGTKVASGVYVVSALVRFTDGEEINYNKSVTVVR